MQAELLRKTIHNFPKRYGQDSTASGAKVLPSLQGLLENSARPRQGVGLGVGLGVGPGAGGG